MDIGDIKSVERIMDDPDYQDTLCKYMGKEIEKDVHKNNVV